MSENIDIGLLAGRAYWREYFPVEAGNGKVEITVRSPFREDNNPSFGINIETGLWTDRATGESGNIVTFHAQMHKMDTKAAFKDLVKKYGDTDAPPQTARATAKKEKESAKEKEEKRKARAIPENIAEVYKYQNLDGSTRFEKVRYEEQGYEKNFGYRREINGSYKYTLGGIETLLYRLPELVEDIALDRIIYFVEGEKDVDNLRKAGLCATSTPEGAQGKWKDIYTPFLSGARVVIIPDNDEAGEKHEQKLCKALYGTVASLRILRLPNLPEKGDVSDWLKMGGTVDELHKLTAEAAEYIPVNEPEAIEAPPLDDEKPSKIQRIEKYLSHFWEFRYNIMEDEPEYKPREGEKGWTKVEDRFASSVMRKMEYDGMMVSSNRLRSILISDFSPEFDPFQDYFANLPKWDGKDYISEYANIIPVRNNDHDTLHLYFRKWLIAAVATALGRGRSPNQTCLILIGSQGDGKTNFLRTLAPKPLRNYYTEAKIKRNDKDSEIMIARNFIINFDELQGLRKDEIEEFKSLGVRSFVKVRRQYATFTTVMRRTASFVGSTNQEDFLTDLTGARRFLCVKVHGRIQWQMVTDDLVTGVYAQALHLLNEGAQYWFTDEEINHINEQNEAFRQTLIEEELLLMWFKPTTWEDGLEYLTNTEILTRLQTKAPNTRIDPKNLGRALRKHGFIQRNRKRSGMPLKCYAVQALLDSSISNISGNDDDDKQPF